MTRLPVFNGGLADSVPTGAPADPVPLAARGKIGQPGWLNDGQGRRLRYLRLSVTDRCDLRCEYCMPVEGTPASSRDDVLSIEELVRVVRVFGRMGVETVRLTGGEPLVRRGVDALVRMIHDGGITDIAMTTNASALAPLAERLVRAGLARLNVSLDSLRPEVFSKLTRGGDIERVVAGIDAARAAGVGVIKTNTVVIRGTNDDELASIVEWAWARDIVPRFIELMPIGEGGAIGNKAVVPAAEMRAGLSRLIDVDDSPRFRVDRGPAGYHLARDGSGRKVGFITAVTENFCERCNRVRVTAKGDIRACLASPAGLSLREMMREGHDDDALVELIAAALYGKQEGHAFNVAGVDLHRGVAMSRVGG